MSLPRTSSQTFPISHRQRVETIFERHFDCLASFPFFNFSFFLLKNFTYKQTKKINRKRRAQHFLIVFHFSGSIERMAGMDGWPSPQPSPKQCGAASDAKKGISLLYFISQRRQRKTFIAIQNRTEEKCQADRTIKTRWGIN